MPPGGDACISEQGHLQGHQDRVRHQKTNHIASFPAAIQPHFPTNEDEVRQSSQWKVCWDQWVYINICFNQKGGTVGILVGTKNGTSGARKEILRPLFNTNTPSPILHFWVNNGTIHGWGDIFLDFRCAPASKTRFGSLGGISFRLLWRPLPLVALVLVCSGSLRMEADRADSWQSL